MESQNTPNRGPPSLYFCMHLATVFSTSLNVFALYVILYQTPSPMKSYARYLLMNQAVITALDFVAFWLVSPWLMFPIPGGMCTGLFASMGVPTAAQVVCGIFLMGANMATMAELFFQRHQCIVPKCSWLRFSPRVVGMWYLLLTFCMFLAIALPTWFVLNNVCDQEKLSQKYPDHSWMMYQKGFYCLTDALVPQVVHIVFVLLSVILFGLAVFVSSSIYYLYYYKDAWVSRKTRDMQKSLLKTLTIQTVVPLAFLLIPFVVSLYIIEKERIDLLGLNPWIVLLFSMHGPCSTILVLFLYAPYHAYMKKLFFRFTCTGQLVADSMESRASIAWIEQRTRRHSEK